MSKTDNIGLKKPKLQYALSADNFEAIQRIIIQKYTKNATPSLKPVAILLGAQPGAGKTELQKISEHQLSKNVVVCNADNFRDFHP